MHHVSIELYKHKWKFGRTRNAVGTQATISKCKFSLLLSSLRQQRALVLCLHRVIQTQFLTNQRACFTVKLKSLLSPGACYY